MRVNPKALVRRLSPKCTQLLEDTVVAAAERGFYEVDVVQLIGRILDDPHTGARRILMSLGAPVDAIRGELVQLVGAQRTGSRKRPVFAERLFAWLEDAWLLASLECDADSIDSAHLLYVLVQDPGQYADASLGTLADVDLEGVRRRLHESRDGEATPPARPTLFDRVEDLERRVAVLESGSAVPPPPSSARARENNVVVFPSSEPEDVDADPDDPLAD